MGENRQEELHQKLMEELQKNEEQRSGVEQGIKQLEQTEGSFFDCLHDYLCIWNEVREGFRGRESDSFFQEIEEQAGTYRQGFEAEIEQKKETLLDKKKELYMKEDELQESYQREQSREGD